MRCERIVQNLNRFGIRELEANNRFDVDVRAFGNSGSLHGKSWAGNRSRILCKRLLTQRTIGESGSLQIVYTALVKLMTATWQKQASLADALFLIVKLL